MQRIEGTSTALGRTPRTGTRGPQSLVVLLSNCTRVVAEIDCPVEFIEGRAEHEAIEEQMTLRTDRGVPLDVLFKAPRGTPDDQLEWALEQSLKQAAKQAAQKKRPKE